MKDDEGQKPMQRRSLPRWAKRVLLLIGLVLLAWIVVQMPRIVSTVRFFCLMGRVDPWTEVAPHPDAYHLEMLYRFAPYEEEYPLEPLKEVARLLLRQPEQHRRRLIAWYDGYAQHRADCIAPGSKLFLLNRLLFDLPQYSSADAVPPGFGWVWDRPGLGGESINVLWPLAYDVNQDLVLADGYYGGFGLCHNGLAEYTHFAHLFPLRSIEDLE